MKQGSKCNNDSTKSILIKLLKYLVGIGLVFILVTVWIATAFIVHPLNLLITATTVALILYRLLKKEHWIIWCCIIVLFVVTGIYFIFNNNLPDPIMWAIADNPIDVPSQWFDNYRLFWWGVIVNRTCQYAGSVAFCFLLIVKLIKFILNKRHG
jgi:hypothetical protein